MKLTEKQLSLLCLLVIIGFLFNSLTPMGYIHIIGYVMIGIGAYSFGCLLANK